MKRGRRQLGKQPLALFGTLLGHDRREPLQGVAAGTAGVLQLVDQEEQDVEIPDPAEPPCHFPEPTAEFACDVTVELQNGQHLAEAARRHTGAVQCAYIASVEAV